MMSDFANIIADPSASLSRLGIRYLRPLLQERLLIFLNSSQWSEERIAALTLQELGQMTSVATGEMLRTLQQSAQTAQDILWSEANNGQTSALWVNLSDQMIDHPQCLNLWQQQPVPWQRVFATEQSVVFFNQLNPERAYHAAIDARLRGHKSSYFAERFMK